MIKNSANGADSAFAAGPVRISMGSVDELPPRHTHVYFGTSLAVLSPCHSSKVSASIAATPTAMSTMCRKEPLRDVLLR